ncbi:pseudouridylate synthase [Methanobrevibacter ruminantium M1]|uniref:tRNA pseudouridine synthase Pus10 n=1 Tax=Methanobrevibacter ruminantium (strain ATCC 35063 / DSM 1093 / JCM 13430 / OCM 146 / M1) TaxID=634498 RepID=D3DYU5_METRM|nr:tRNA pseudouridine(54/55) synthase Pus10 [Methanobrevibacter ruminantium]ADC46015.1 pseudouridylate synthase [Methanobrevibacter ruminantium M1]
MNQEILNKAEELINHTNGNICNHCLGRKFSDCVEGDGNEDRGAKIRQALNLEPYKANEDNPANDEKCLICNDLFEDLNTVLDLVNEKIDLLKVEFDTFVVGCKLPKEIVEKDQEISDEFDFNVEIIKKEVNREIGKLLESNLEQNVDFDGEDVLVMVDFRRILKEDIENPIKVRLQINPIFIEGRYRKLIRTIPQTKWPCRKCKGKGCEECNFTGKQYPESVEELLSEVVLKHTNGYEAKFHGAGREDIDVRMLGTGRPFVLEIKEPKIRKIDLKKIEEEVAISAKGKTEYLNLKFTERRRKAEIKESSPDTYKVYRALVKCEDYIKEEDLEKLQTLHIIQQRTPIRVSHRRADKIRQKEVKEIKAEFIDSKTFEMIIKTEGGLYIKELISSDEGRSNPSVSEVLGTQAICAELDVIEVGIK